MANQSGFGERLTPPGTGSFPGLILVAGSGPLERDWTSPFLPRSHGAAPLQDEVPVINGFAPRRYDKRASYHDIARANRKRRDREFRVITV